MNCRSINQNLYQSGVVTFLKKVSLLLLFIGIASPSFPQQSDSENEYSDTDDQDNADYQEDSNYQDEETSYVDSDTSYQESSDVGEDEPKFEFKSDFSIGLERGLEKTGDANAISNFSQDSYFNLLGKSNWNSHALAFSVDVTKAGQELTGDEDTITTDRTVSADLYTQIDYSDRLSFIAAVSQKEAMRDEDHPDSIYFDGEESISQSRTLAVGTIWTGEFLKFTSKYHQQTIKDVTQSGNSIMSNSDRDQTFLRLELGRKIGGGEISLLTGVTEVKYADSIADRDLTGTLLGTKIAFRGKNHNFQSYVYQNNRTYSNDLFGKKQLYAGYINLDWDISKKLNLRSNVKRSFLERNLEPYDSTGIIEESAAFSLNYVFTPKISTAFLVDKIIYSAEGLNERDESDSKTISLNYEINSNVSTSGSLSQTTELQSGLNSEYLVRKVGGIVNFNLMPKISLNGTLDYEIETGDKGNRKKFSSILDADYQITQKLSVKVSQQFENEESDFENRRDINNGIELKYDVSDAFSLSSSLLSENRRNDLGSSLTTTKDVGMSYQLRDDISLIGSLKQINSSAADTLDNDNVSAILRIEGTF